MADGWGRTRATLGLASLVLVAAVAARAEDPLTVYVGTYTDGTSRGVYRYGLDPASGRADAPVLAAAAQNPSFIVLHPSGRFLYAVSELDEFEGAPTGAVAAFAVEAKSGDLSLLDRVASGGGAPCHLAIDRAGRNLLVANYGGGSVALLRVGADGRIAPAVVRQHAGHGPNAERQQGPHAHGVYLDAAERFVLVPDLGADRVFVYRFDGQKGSLEPHGGAALPPGSGPRHLAFHPDGRHVYVINELANTVTAFGYDPAQGELSLLETLGTLPPDFEGTSYTAEIAVSPDGRFLYGSNRGHDSLVVFRIDPKSGRLTLVGHVPAGGPWPRHFTIAAGGSLLLAAHQRGGTISLFRLDPASGLPVAFGAAVAVDRPVCLLPVAGGR